MTFVGQKKTKDQQLTQNCGPDRQRNNEFKASGSICLKVG